MTTMMRCAGTAVALVAAVAVVCARAASETRCHDEITSRRIAGDVVVKYAVKAEKLQSFRVDCLDVRMRLDNGCGSTDGWSVMLVVEDLVTHDKLQEVNLSALEDSSLLQMLLYRGATDALRIDLRAPGSSEACPVTMTMRWSVRLRDASVRTPTITSVSPAYIHAGEPTQIMMHVPEGAVWRFRGLGHCKQNVAEGVVVPAGSVRVDMTTPPDGGEWPVCFSSDGVENDDTRVVVLGGDALYVRHECEYIEGEADKATDDLGPPQRCRITVMGSRLAADDFTVDLVTMEGVPCAGITEYPHWELTRVVGTGLRRSTALIRYQMPLCVLKPQYKVQFAKTGRWETATQLEKYSGAQRRAIREGGGATRGPATAPPGSAGEPSGMHRVGMAMLSAALVVAVVGHAVAGKALMHRRERRAAKWSELLVLRDGCVDWPSDAGACVSETTAAVEGDEELAVEAVVPGDGPDGGTGCTGWETHGDLWCS